MRLAPKDRSQRLPKRTTFLADGRFSMNHIFIFTAPTKH